MNVTQKDNFTSYLISHRNDKLYLFSVSFNVKVLILKAEFSSQYYSHVIIHNKK